MQHDTGDIKILVYYALPNMVHISSEWV